MIHLLWVLRMYFQSFHISLVPLPLEISSRTLSPLVFFLKTFNLSFSSSPCWGFHFSFQCGNRNYKRIFPITKVTNIPVFVILQCFSSAIVNELFLFILKAKYFLCTLNPILPKILKGLCSYRFTPFSSLPLSFHSPIQIWSFPIFTNGPIIQSVSNLRIILDLLLYFTSLPPKYHIIPC